MRTRTCLDIFAVGYQPDLGRGWKYHFTTTLRYGLGIPLLAAGVLGLLFMVWREERRGVLVALFPVAYYVLMGTGRTVFARYALPAVPFLCLTAGYLVATTAAAVTTSSTAPRLADSGDDGHDGRSVVAVDAVRHRVRSV